MKRWYIKYSNLIYKRKIWQVENANFEKHYTYEFCDNECTLATFGSESSALRIGNALLRNLRVWFFISALWKKFTNVVNLIKNYLMPRSE